MFVANCVRPVTVVINITVKMSSLCLLRARYQLLSVSINSTDKNLCNPSRDKAPLLSITI